MGKAGRDGVLQRHAHGDPLLPARLHLLPTSVTSWRFSLSHMCLWGTFDIEVIICHMVKKIRGPLILKVRYMLQEIRKYFRKKQGPGEAAGIEHLCRKLNRLLRESDEGRMVCFHGVLNQGEAWLGQGQDRNVVCTGFPTSGSHSSG